MVLQLEFDPLCTYMKCHHCHQRQFYDGEKHFKFQRGLKSAAIFLPLYLSQMHRHTHTYIWSPGALVIVTFLKILSYSEASYSFRAWANENQLSTLRWGEKTKRKSSKAATGLMKLKMKIKANLFLILTNEAGLPVCHPIHHADDCSAALGM